MSKEHNNTLKIPLYGNCRVQNPDGVHIFNCGEKKAKWYLKRNLANIIQQTPLIIRLNFIPNGHGHANDEFYLQERQNICVCCGKNEQLTKHHVVPYCFRRFFPDSFKNHTAYDVLPLCYECHEGYETFAQQFKKQLALEYSIESKSNKIVNSKLKKVCLYATALLHGKKIPQERHDMMMNVIRVYYNRDDLSKDDLERAALIKYNTNREDYKHEGQAVVEQLKSVDEINKFIIRWREHFLKHANPQYMPKYWCLDRL